MGDKYARQECIDACGLHCAFSTRHGGTFTARCALLIKSKPIMISRAMQINYSRSTRCTSRNYLDNITYELARARW